jgi:hypothetical protein
MEIKKDTLYRNVVNKWSGKDRPYERVNAARTTLCNFFRPDLGVDVDEDSDMLMLGGDISEGSGPWVARTAAISYQGNTVSKKLDWYQYAFSDTKLKGIDELDQFCQDIKEHNRSVYQRGNFYDYQPQFTLDGWTTGSPLFFLEEDKRTNHIMCIPIHWKNYRIFYDRYNMSEGVIIKDTEWTAKMCFDKFCPGKTLEERLTKAGEIFSISLQTAIRNNRMSERFTIWRAVFRSDDPIWQVDGFKPPLSSKARPKLWYDVYFEDCKQLNKKNDQLLTTGYYSKPYVHWDYDKKLFESSSRTPAFYAIYDNLTIIQIFRNWIDNTQLRVRPSMAVLTGMESRLDFRPGGIVKIKPGEWNMKPEPIGQIGEVNLEKDQVEIVRENLYRHFHIDLFRMFTDLAYMKDTEMKVFQLAEMAGEKITQLLPMMESHESYLEQVDERVRAIEINAGRGPFSKRNLENIFDIISHYIGPFEADQVKIQPEFIGTLRKTQRMQHNLKPIQLGIGALSETAAALGDPNFVRFAVKRFPTMEAIMTAVDFPQKLANEEAEVERLYKEFQQDQARMEQFAKMVELLKASKGTDMAKMLTGATA